MKLISDKKSEESEIKEDKQERIEVKKEQFNELIPTPVNDRTRKDISLESISCNKIISIGNQSNDKINLPENKKLVRTYYLSPHMRFLCNLFKGISIVYKFNLNRQLNFILYKNIKSLERIVKGKVEEKAIYELVKIAPEAVKVKRIIYEGVNTLKIDVIKDVNLEIEIKKKGIKEEDLLVDEYKMVENITTVKKVSNEIRKKNIIKTGKFSDILSRVKAKEEERRKKFIQLEESKVDIREKLDELFNVMGKKAIKLKDLEFKLKTFKGIDKIKELCNKKKNIIGKYYIKVINKEEYLVIRDIDKDEK